MKKLLINLISAPLKKREKRRRVRCRLTLFFYATQLRRAFARFPELNDKIIVATNGGLADQLTFLFAIREFQKADAQVVFNLTDLKTDLAQSARLYKYDEVAAAFGKTKREIVNDFATTPFELYKYKINWDGVLFANLPAEFVDLVKIDGITAAKIDRKTARLAPLYLDGIGCLPPKESLFEKYKNDLQNLEIIYKLNAANAEMRAKIRDAENSICIHIRRGDYVNFMGGKTVSAEYFHKSINEIIRRAGWTNATCFVFSDDMEWAKTAVDYGAAAVHFVEINDITDPQSELELMRNCKHFILSAGHFGRLAFAMCRNPGKIMIRPAKNDFIISGT